MLISLDSYGFLTAPLYLERMRSAVAFEKIEDCEELSMSSKSTKLILIVFLLFSLLLSVFGCMTASSDPNSLPVKELAITIDVNHLEEFRTQLRKFADKHSLTFTEAFYNGDHTYFSVFI